MRICARIIIGRSVNTSFRSYDHLQSAQLQLWFLIRSRISSRGGGTYTPQVPWKPTDTLTYGAYGGRQVLIIFSDVPLPDRPEAIPRRDGQLTEKDREKLRSERVKVSGDYQDESDIVRQRYDLDKAKKIFAVLESKPDKLLARSEAYGVIAALMNNTENDGGMIVCSYQIVEQIIPHTKVYKQQINLSKYCPSYPHPGKGGDLGGDLTQLKSMPLMTGQLCRSIHCYYNWSNGCQYGFRASNASHQQHIIQSNPPPNPLPWPGRG